MLTQTNFVPPPALLIFALALSALSTSTLASAATLAPGEFEFVSKRLDGPKTSSGINGNSQVEDVSSDGRLVVFNTEGNYTSARRGDAKSLIFDRQTGSVELLDPDPAWRSTNLMVHDGNRYLSFFSKSPTVVPAGNSESLEQFFDLFTWDRQTNTFERHTSGLNIEVTPERKATMSNDGARIVFRTFGDGSRDGDRLDRGYYLFDRNSDSLRLLSQDPFDRTQRRISDVQISKSGKWILYKEDDASGPDSDIVFRHLDTDERRVLDTDLAHFLDLGFDGTELLYLDISGNGERVVYHYNSETEVQTRFLPQANGAISSAAFSGDGRFILFESTATNLVAGPDPSGSTPDLYRLTVATGNIERLSRMKPGGLSPHSVNFDGSVVAFEDDANVYDADDPNGGYSDVFVYTDSSSDFVRASNTVEPYTVFGANGDSLEGVLSGNGRLIAFLSEASDLTPNDTNDNTDLFFANRLSGELRNITAASSGVLSQPSMSASGQDVVFLATGDGLGSGRLGDGYNLYLYDSQLDQITNLTAAVVPANASWQITSMNPRISADGNRVVFHTSEGVKVWDRTSQQLTDLSSAFVFSAQLNVDGTIALLETRLGNHQVAELYNVANQQMIDSTRGTADHVVSPQMSDDAQRIVFYSSRDVLPDDMRTDGLYLWDRGEQSYRYLGFVGHTASERDSFAISRDGSTAVGQIYIGSTSGNTRHCRNNIGGQVYNLADGTASSLPCIEDEPFLGRSLSRPALSANGDLILNATRTRYVQTDINATDNLYVLRLSGEPEPGNTPPVAAELTATTTAGRAVNIRLAGTDADGDSLNFAVVDPPTAGTLTGAPPQLIYTPAASYTGTDSFTYVANDGQTNSTPALVSLRIDAASTLSFTAVQRAGSRTIDITASWPDEAQWTQVRVFDELSSVLWDGQALQWSGAYAPDAAATSVTFNSRYWVAGVEMGNTNFTVNLSGTDDGLTLTGYAWIDTSNDSFRDSAEPADVGRAVDLFRCEAPWGLVDSTLSMAPNGKFSFVGLAPGKYQIGTPAVGVEFSPPTNDNQVFSNGFSNCLTVDGNQPAIGIGLVSADLPRIRVSGFAWVDGNNNSLKEINEAGDQGRKVTMYRCKAPWGAAGTAVTDAEGNFTIANVVPDEYQFGTSADVRFSPVQRDNLIYANGFSNCVNFSVEQPQIGIGVVQ